MAWEYLIDVVPVVLKGLPVSHFFTLLENMYSHPGKLLIDPKIDEIYKAQAVARTASRKVSKKRRNSSVGTSPSAQLGTQEAKIVLSPRRVPVNISEMLEPATRPKENSFPSIDSFDSDRAPMKHHITYHRSSSPRLEVLKQTDVVEGANNELLDYGERDDDQIDYDPYSELSEVIGFSTQAVFFSSGATERFTNLPAVKMKMIFLDTSFVDRNRAQQEFVGDGDNVIFYVGSALLGASLEGKNGTQENFPTDKEDLVPEVVGAIPSEDVIVDNVIPSPLPSLPLLAIEQTVVADVEEEDVDDYARIVAKVFLSKLFLRFKRTPLDQLHSLSSFVDKTFNLLEGLPLDLFVIKSKVN
ncbi:hypothetical protein MRB53_024208 [Persea americana]|uniref:Uncharacterized protein n=1 Tax=Persea americana TaxID=3435 RepID=A0ACC2LBQ3_PERAE|nr:hypothetical protein MRB53_024208 [Persea americana]